MPLGYMGPGGNWVTPPDTPAQGGVIAGDIAYELTALVNSAGIAWASLPAAASWPGMITPINDFATRPLFRSDGTSWRPLAPCDIVVDLPVSPSAGAANTTEQVLRQFTLPAGLLMGCRYFVAKVLVAKSGAAETATIRLRLGSNVTGGLGDQAILTNNSTLAGTARAAAVEASFFASSSTQVRGLARDSAFGVGAFIAGSTTTTYPTNFSVPDMAANVLTLSVTAQMSVGAETATVAHVILTVA